MLFKKEDFPLLVSHKTLSYLDNAATSQKPFACIEAISRFYSEYNAPVHRGIYSLAEEATGRYEDARISVARYCGAHSDEIFFTKGATESINFIASSWASKMLKPGDEIIISELEHHANILPWLRLEAELGFIVKYIPTYAHGLLNYEAYGAMLTPRTKLVAITHTSNVLGTRIDLPFIIEQAKAVGAKVLVDACQAAGREHLSLNHLGADFVAFSGHKMLGPTGIGVLYIERNSQEEVSPYQLGGGMVQSVAFHGYELLKGPQRYEAGTPPIAQALGLEAAVTYLSQISFDELKKYEAALCKRLIEGLIKLPSVRVLGPLEQLAQSGHMVSFVSSKAHAHDIAAFLDTESICVRAGNHCAQPLHARLNIEASVRVSFYGYSSAEEVDRLLTLLWRFEKTF
jgi:cysteine desulfurase/selenocysteine lyase